MAEESFSLPAFAKINLNLRVLGKRGDGFHEICTVFQTVSLCDRLTFSGGDGIRLTCSDANVPTDESNLIVRAANLLREKFNIGPGARIHLEKRIPSPGGLGGGSSDGAVALAGLARLWHLPLRLSDLIPLGRILGSDVPFFFFGGTALGTGRGTEVFPLDDVVENHLLIVTPGVDVPTPQAFRLLGAPHLTNKDSKSILQICRFEARALNLRQSDLVNDFEKAVFQIEPEIGRVRERLFRLGARRALMSGSGASVFAVFDSKEKLQDAFDDLQNEPDWRKFRVKTVPRRDYLGSLNLIEGLLH
ncbi:MAG: 4-(cytidine 5'-diphospho)-2-C-methyl-D-erythritol kinase [Pyrinomonadaceae bacterium]